MRLFFNQTSPYARKARIAAHESGLAGTIVFVEVDPWAEPSEFIAVNPLSKVPALLLDDGRLVTESDTIVQTLAGLAPQPGLIAPDTAERLASLARAALCQGLIDASFIAVIEGRRPEPQRWTAWVERQERAVMRTLSAIDGAFDLPAGRFDIGDIGLAVALAYLDFRLPHLAWRGAHPRLAAWLDVVAQRPSMLATRPG